MEKHTAKIGGKDYNLPPWNAGQFRRLVDPILEETKEILDRLETIKEGAEPDGQTMLALTISKRQIDVKHTELVLEALKNEYPHMSMVELETLTPTRITQLFNEILLITTSGTNEPGEVKPPRKQKP